MSKKKACKICKRLVNSGDCPNCKKGSFANSWQGRISVIDSAKSEIAKKIGIEINGEYAIKTR